MKFVSFSTYANETTTGLRYRASERGRCVTTIMMDFKCQLRWLRLYDDDLKNVAEIHASIADMCDKMQKDRRRAFSVVLKGTALSLFTTTMNVDRTFQEGSRVLRTWFKPSTSRSSPWRVVRHVAIFRNGSSPGRF